MKLWLIHCLTVRSLIFQNQKAESDVTSEGSTPASPFYFVKSTPKSANLWLKAKSSPNVNQQKKWPKINHKMLL